MALRLHPRWLKSDLQALASPSHLTHSPFAVMSGTSAQEPGGNSAPPPPPPSKPGAGVPLAKKASAAPPKEPEAPPVLVPPKQAAMAPPVMVPPKQAAKVPPAMVPPGNLEHLEQRTREVARQLELERQRVDQLDLQLQQERLLTEAATQEHLELQQRQKQLQQGGNAGAPRPPVLPPPIGLIHGTAGRVVQGGVPIKAAGVAHKAPRSYPPVPMFQDPPSGPPAKAPTQVGPSEPSGSSVPIAATTSKAKMPPLTPVPQRQLEARLLVRSSTWHEGPSMPPGWARSLEWVSAMAKQSNAWPKPAYFPEGAKPTG